jgi:hypothetical protein
MKYNLLLYYNLLQIIHKIMSLEQQTNIVSVQVFQASFADWY